MPNTSFWFKMMQKTPLKRAPKLVVLMSWMAGILLVESGCMNQFDHASLVSDSLTPCAEVEDPSSVQGSDLLLVVLAGQSIMSGRGTLTDLPDRFRTCRNDILLFGNDYRWRYAHEPIDDGRNQVDAVSVDSNAAVSPGTAFAIAYLDLAPGKRIVLIPCAKGGSLIEEWQRNRNRDSLYGSCLFRFRMAMRYGQPLALLFQQGESDAVDPERLFPRQPRPHQWDEMFIRFIEGFRRDSGVANLPVVYTRMGRNGNPRKYVNWKTVRKSQERASKKLTNVALVYTDDLPLQDEVHLTTRGTIILGERYAERLQQLVSEE